MRKKHISKLFYGAALATLLSASPAFAFGWPTFDIAEVFNTIQSVISQAQAQIATVQETISVANIQQAIGDKLGALSKIKDYKAKAEKAKEKADKIQKRVQKVKALKEKYEKEARDAIEQVQEKYQEGVNFVNDTKNQIEGVKNQVENTINDAKNQVEGLKNQVEGAINDAQNQVENAKNQVENAKNQVENAYNNAKNQVENVKNQVENTKNQVENAMNNARGQAEGLYGGLQNGFGNMNNAADGSFEPFQFGHSENGGSDGSNAGMTSGKNSYSSGSNGGYSGTVTDEDLWGNDDFDDVTVGVTLPNNGGAFQDKFVGNRESFEDSGEDISGEDPGTTNVTNTGARAAFKPSSKSSFGNEQVVGEQTTALPTSEEGMSLFGEEPAPVLNKTPMKSSNNKSEVPAENNTTMRKAFGKVSYNFVSINSFAAQSASFKTGTDEAGNYYYPDTFANWVGFNFDEKLDEDKMEAAVKTICDDLNSGREQDVAAYKTRYIDMIKEARAYAEAYAATAVGSTESEKTTDDLSQMIDTASDSARTQLAGIGEMGVNEIAQNKKQMIMIANTLQADVFDEILQYCRITYEKGEDEGN